MVLPLGLDLRKPIKNLLGRVIGAVLPADRPPHDVNQLVTEPEAQRPATVPQRVDEFEAIVDRDFVDPLAAEHRKNAKLESTAVPNVGVRSRPVLLLVRDDEVDSVPNRRSRTRLMGLPGITTLTGDAPILRRELAGSFQGNEGVRTQTEITTLTADHDPQDPAARPGVADEQVETVTVGIPTGTHLFTDDVGEPKSRTTSEPRSVVRGPTRRRTRHGLNLHGLRGGRAQAHETLTDPGKKGRIASRMA